MVDQDRGDCLTDDQIQQIVDAVCLPNQQSRFEKHLGDCRSCQRRLEEFSGTVSGAIDANRAAASSTELSKVINRISSLDSDSLRMATPGYADVDSRESSSFNTFKRQSGHPSRLNQYDVQELLGRGGMGEVFAALDTVLNRMVAIKIPSSSLTATVETRERLVREARAIAAVKHENIVTLYGIEEANGTLFLVMELINGESLAHRLRSTPKLPWKILLPIAQQIAAALSAAHQLGVVHRDVKPANILLESKTQRVKVTDFGLASSDVDRSITSTGTLAGTPEFMSPEQAAETHVDTASDVFSFGTVLYQACTGISPFHAPSTLSILRRVCEETPQPLSDQEPGVPIWFSQLVQRMLAKDPPGRPSMSEVHEALLNQGRVNQRVSTATPKLRQSDIDRRSLIIIAAMCCCLLLVVPFVYSPTQTPPTSSGSLFRILESSKSFDNLGTAIDAADDGDTIEITGDGPFSTPGYSITGKKLTIRAANNSCPTFVCESENTDCPFISSDSNLHLEGLQVKWANTARASNTLVDRASCSIVAAIGSDVTLSHCRLTTESKNGCLGCDSGSIELSNSHLIAPTGSCVIWIPADDDGIESRNCIFECGKTGIVISGRADQIHSASSPITLENNSFSVSVALSLMMERPMRSFDVINRQNAFDASAVLRVTRGATAPMANMRKEVQKRVVLSKLNWTESQNGYRTGTCYMRRGRVGQDHPQMVIEPTMRGWLAALGCDDPGSFETEFLPRGLSDDADSDADPLANIRVAPNSVLIGADLRHVGPQRTGS